MVITLTNRYYPCRPQSASPAGELNFSLISASSACAALIQRHRQTGILGALFCVSALQKYPLACYIFICRTK
jgi:hypothetical protein